MKYLVKFFVVTFLVLISTHAVAEQKLVYLDLKFVLNSSKAGKEAQDFLQKTFKTNQKKYADLEVELKKEENDLLANKTTLSKEYFQVKHSSLYIEKLIPGFTKDKTLNLDKNILSPLGSLSYYISSTQSQETFIHLRPFRLESDNKNMRVTLTTLKGLEIFPKSREAYKDSLLGFFDKTQTSLGSRRLKHFFLHQ